MDLEDSPLLNISKSKLNPAHPAFLHSQRREKDTDGDWFFSLASSPVSQKNDACSLSQKTVTTVSTTPWRSEVSGNDSFGFYLRKTLQSYKYGSTIFHKKFRLWNHHRSSILQPLSHHGILFPAWHQWLKDQLKVVRQVNLEGLPMSSIQTVTFLF